eukprot:Gb_35117 [translate_table: standard]
MVSFPSVAHLLHPLPHKSSHRYNDYHLVSFNHLHPMAMLYNVNVRLRRGVSLSGPSLGQLLALLSFYQRSPPPNEQIVPNAHNPLIANEGSQGTQQGANNILTTSKASSQQRTGGVNVYTVSQWFLLPISVLLKNSQSAQAFNKLSPMSSVLPTNSHNKSSNSTIGDSSTCYHSHDNLH